MALNTGYDKYRKNTVFTSTPEELTLMLYNGMIKFIMQAQVAIDEKMIEKANNCVVRAQNIVIELRATLDRKYEISKNLDLMYDYMYRRLLDANISKDKEILGEVLKFAKDLRDTWEQAMKIAKQQNRQAQGQHNKNIVNR